MGSQRVRHDLVTEYTPETVAGEGVNGELKCMVNDHIWGASSWPLTIWPLETWQGGDGEHPRLAFWTSRLSQVLLPAFWVPHVFVVRIPREPVQVNDWSSITTDKNNRVLVYIVSALVIRCTGNDFLSQTCVNDRWRADSPENQMLLQGLAMLEWEGSPTLRLSQWKQFSLRWLTHCWNIL